MALIDIPGSLQPIAKVIKTYGADNSLIIKLIDIDFEDIDSTEPVYVNIDGLPVPFFIHPEKRKGETQAIVSLSPITPAIIEEIIGETVYAAYTFEEELDEDDYSMLVGFTVSNENNETVGTVTDFIDIPANPCIEVKTENGKEVILPLSEDLIIDFLPDKHLLKLEIPEGLLHLE